MKVPNRMLAAGAWVLEHSHRAALAVTGGRFPKSILGMEPIELHHIGRVSGQRRSTLLSAPICTDDMVVLVASKGGYDDHPDWYKNLAAHPEVELTIRNVVVPMTARTATPSEKDELWPRIVSVYSGYDGYQRNTTRDIPVVICTPR